MKGWRMRWAGCVEGMVEKGNVCRLLVGQLEGKRQLGRPRCRWVKKVNTDLVAVGCCDVD
jgi:hypothetical protein